MKGRYISLMELILLMRYTHLYYCPVGDHFGAIVENTPACPMECNVR